MVANVIISIIFKFASVVCLRLALEEYENLSNNSSYFLFSLMTSLSTSCLMAPIFTYDHVNCMPRNFIINQSTAEFVALITVILSALPVCLYMMLPNTLRKFNCCTRLLNYKKIENLEINEGP